MGSDKTLKTSKMEKARLLFKKRGFSSSGGGKLKKKTPTDPLVIYGGRRKEKQNGRLCGQKGRYGHIEIKKKDPNRQAHKKRKRRLVCGKNLGGCTAAVDWGQSSNHGTRGKGEGGISFFRRRLTPERNNEKCQYSQGLIGFARPAPVKKTELQIRNKGNRLPGIHGGKWGRGEGKKRYDETEVTKGEEKTESNIQRNQLQGK